MHAGNVHMSISGDLYVVDWDTMIMAPKERDLMYLGGGQFMNRHTPEEEERLFYEGYDETEVDPVGIAYG